MKETWDFERDPLSALRRGDPALFEAFVRAETPTLIAFFGRLGARPGEAEDLTQELLLKLFQNATHYQNQGRFGQYVFRIARNAWIDSLRGRARRIPDTRSPGESPADQSADLERPGANTSPEPGSELALKEEVARLRRAVSELPENHRLVFELGVGQELAYADIAAALGIPVGTVKSRMHYAIAKLRASLESGS